jgi:hypothetical protein
VPARWQSPDLDEVRPGLFVVNNAKTGPFLRGEGEREGSFFRLLTTRREGWLARLRMAGFNVRTLQGRVAALPAIAQDVQRGPEGLRTLSHTREQIAGWDAGRLRWIDRPVVDINGLHGVRLCANEPLRRRRSRAGGDYFVAVLEPPDRINLRPVTEEDAILQAYALLHGTGESPRLAAERTADGYLLPSGRALLPPVYRQALGYLSEPHAEPWTFAEPQLPLVRQVLEKLGILLELGDERSAS